MYNKATRLVVMLFVLVFLVLSSVVFSEEIKSTGKDKLSPKYQSILFGRIRVSTCIRNFNPAGNESFFTMLELHSKKELKDFKIAVKAKERLKLKKDGVDGYDTFFVAGAESGDYLFGYYIFRTNDYYKMSTFIPNADDNEYITGLHTPFLKTCNIPPDSLIYLGVIEINFTGVKKISDNPLQLKYIASINCKFDDYDSDLAKFQKARPKLYEKFKDNVVKVTWDNFGTRNDEDEEEEE